MVDAHELQSKGPFSLDDIVAEQGEYLSFSTPVAKHDVIMAEVALIQAGEGGAKTINDDVIMHNGEIWAPIPAQAELDDSAQALATQETILRSKFGIPEFVSVFDFLHLASHMQVEKRLADNAAAEGKQHFEDTGPRSFNDFKLDVPAFLASVKTMAVNTGDNYSVWLNGYHTVKVEIGADANIEELSIAAKAMDYADASHIIFSKVHTIQEKNWNTKARVDSWYPSVFDSNGDPIPNVTITFEDSADLNEGVALIAESRGLDPVQAVMRAYRTRKEFLAMEIAAGLERHD